MFYGDKFCMFVTSNEVIKLVLTKEIISLSHDQAEGVGKVTILNTNSNNSYKLEFQASFEDFTDFSKKALTGKE